MSANYLKKERFYWLKILADFLLLASAFCGVYFFRRGHLAIEAEFRLLFPVITGLWLVGTLLSKKFLIQERSDFFTTVRPFFNTVLFVTGAVSLFIYVSGLYHVSRFITFGTLAVFLGAEVFVLALLQFLVRQRDRKRSFPLSGVFFLTEILLFLISFNSVYLWRRKTILFLEDYPVLFMGILCGWLIAATFSHRFQLKGKKLLNALAPFWKGQVMLLTGTAFFLIIAGQSFYSRFIVLGTIVVFSVLENLLVLGMFLFLPAEFMRAARTENLVSPEYSGRITEKEWITPDLRPYRLPGSVLQSVFVREQLRQIYLSREPELFKFLDSKLGLEKIDVIRSAIIDSENKHCLSRFPENSLDFLFNFSRINDIRRLNRYFIQANESLRTSGVLVVKFESVQQRRERIFSTLPLALARVVYLGHFLLRRAMPKLPVLKKIYFFCSRGKNRAISFTECMGRLFYCGFSIVSWKEIDGFIYFLVKKTGEPEKNIRPSYGLLFRQRRVGKDGRIIHMYKMRTMHPYSEFIQDYVHSQHDLAKSGKIRADFRITGWGKIMRRLMLDELPMLINWLKRDVKLVGVRPISEAFFATYPKHLQQERIRVKPGLIPPYYADMPENIREVWQSESTYLKKYQQNRWITDIKYFFRALNNILFHHAKSG